MGQLALSVGPLRPHRVNVQKALILASPYGGFPRPHPLQDAQRSCKIGSLKGRISAPATGDQPPGRPRIGWAAKHSKHKRETSQGLLKGSRESPTLSSSDKDKRPLSAHPFKKENPMEYWSVITPKHAAALSLEAFPLALSKQLEEELSGMSTERGKISGKQEVELGRGEGILKRREGSATAVRLENATVGAGQDTPSPLLLQDYRAQSHGGA
ncbi:uncharacterized protein LOC113834881 [Cricetulus griseus]|uniref:Uncharacterized protein LOC113834881 n=1 Tax=Cricetulus griseus TaxID=10029 RepID=A0A9J7GTS4_CRIGR|nr:uncharacterized protein LOC113834881 [Cricetulus griseus]